MSDRKAIPQGVFKDVREAEHYDTESRLWMRNVVKDFARAAVRWGVTGGRVLDIGCGSGLRTIGLAGMLPCVQVTGLDLSEPVLDRALQSAIDSGVADRVSFEKGDAENIPFDSYSFDMVICLSTLHLVNNPVKMLDEIQRVLRTGGRFYIRDYRRTWMGLLSPHIRACYTPQEATDLLKRSQLQNWQVRGGVFWLSILSKE